MGPFPAREKPRGRTLVRSGSPGRLGSRNHGWAAERGYVVFTNDLDFTALLAATQATAPSVIQVRTQDVLPEGIGDLALRVFRRFEKELKEGALISVEPARARIRVLPLGD